MNQGHSLFKLIVKCEFVWAVEKSIPKIKQDNCFKIRQIISPNARSFYCWA